MKECLPFPQFLFFLTHLGQGRIPEDQTFLGSCRTQKQQEGVEPPLGTKIISLQLLSLQTEVPSGCLRPKKLDSVGPLSWAVPGP